MNPQTERTLDRRKKALFPLFEITNGYVSGSPIIDASRIEETSTISLTIKMLPHFSGWRYLRGLKAIRLSSRIEIKVVPNEAEGSISMVFNGKDLVHKKHDFTPRDIIKTIERLKEKSETKGRLNDQGIELIERAAKLQKIPNKSADIDDGVEYRLGVEIKEFIAFYKILERDGLLSIEEKEAIYRLNRDNNTPQGTVLIPNVPDLISRLPNSFKAVAEQARDSSFPTEKHLTIPLTTSEQFKFLGRLAEEVKTRISDQLSRITVTEQHSIATTKSKAQRIFLEVMDAAPIRREIEPEARAKIKKVNDPEYDGHSLEIVNGKTIPFGITVKGKKILIVGNKQADLDANKTPTLPYQLVGNRQRDLNATLPHPENDSDRRDGDIYYFLEAVMEHAKKVLESKGYEGVKKSRFHHIVEVPIPKKGIFSTRDGHLRHHANIVNESIAHSIGEAEKVIKNMKKELSSPGLSTNEQPPHTQGNLLKQRVKRSRSHPEKQPDQWSARRTPPRGERSR